jgi:hypothetical protein
MLVIEKAGKENPHIHTPDKMNGPNKCKAYGVPSYAL